MRINCHCHIFNFTSLYSDQTLSIIENRLKEDFNAPDFVRTALVNMLEIIFKRQTEGREFETPHKKFINLLRGLNPGRGSSMPDPITGFPTKKREYLGFKLGHFIERLALELDAQVMDISDWVQFAAIGLMPEINQVTDHLMNQAWEDDIVVPLMMNIASDNPSATDNNVFRKQLEDTVHQGVRYPGRVLPFYAFHPHRPHSVEEFKNEFGRKNRSGKTFSRFIGVKLYPSLGYSVHDKKVIEILRLCVKYDLPVLMHCNPTGFRYGENAAGYCSPNHWRNILSQPDMHGLKICFAHFGGKEEFITPSRPALGTQTRNSWSEDIRELMVTYPKTVFADVACHTFAPRWELMNSDRYVAYMLRLTDFLEDEVTGKLVLWGTDYWMNRAQCQEKSYTNFFQRKLERHFEKMSCQNPAAFLGLTVDRPSAMGGNIQRYIQFIHDQNIDYETLNSHKTASWISPYIQH